MATEQTIRDFTKKQTMIRVHQRYKDLIKDKPELKSHNKYFELYIWQAFVAWGIKVKSVDRKDVLVNDFEHIFIDELFNIDFKERLTDLLSQCNAYDVVTSKLNKSKVIELTKRIGKLIQYPRGLMKLDGQQTLIGHFSKLYGVGIGQFIIGTNQTAFRLFLMSQEFFNLQYYRSYLNHCEEQNGIYVIPKDVANREFHKFNVWLDKFYRDNKLNNHRLEDEEKQFYLYLLKMANDICETFPTYFKGQIDINWWGLDEDRSKSLKQSKTYLDNKNIT